MVVTEGMKLYTKALRSKAAPGSIGARIDQLEQELEMWDHVLHALETKTGKDLDQFLEISTASIAEQAQEASMTVDDLEALRQGFQRIADALNGDIAAAQAPSAEISRFVQRVSKPRGTRVQRFRPEFEMAFRKQHLLSLKGTTITAEALAREFMPAEYHGNPESAVRNMQYGIRRVASEHARCQEHGIPSPFLKAE